MNTQQLLEQFKAISIRGRMAFGIHCLEKALDNYGEDEPIMQLLMERLYEFVESDQKLNVWDRRITDVTPLVLLDDHPSNFLDEYETISEEQAIDLKVEYGMMPDDLCGLIDDVIYTGKSNLYGGVSGYSPSSLSKVERVIGKMQVLKLSLPDINSYRISPFTEWGGWGYIRPMSEFSPVPVR